MKRWRENTKEIVKENSNWQEISKMAGKCKNGRKIPKWWENAKMAGKY